jgi:hypothetical protein
VRGGGEVVRRRVGGAQHLDAEAIQQRAGRKLGPASSSKNELPAPSPELGLDLEDVAQLEREPQASSRSGEERAALGEALPDAPMVAVHASAVAVSRPEILERHAVAVQDAEHVVIRDDQQLGGCAERGLRIGQQAWSTCRCGQTSGRSATSP